VCGIAGIWGWDDGGRVERMLAAMRHRGPDGAGVTRYGGGAAGMVRLALVDLSERGQQPMWSPDGRVALVFNGEMYNFRDERARLAARGYAFRSTSDTEVVLALYLEHGLDFLHHVRGMFALALLDWRGRDLGGEPSLLLARDPFGIKPLYVTGAGSHGIAFSSELRALRAAGLVAPAVDRAALRDYFTFGFVRQPRTIWQGVRMLEPGTYELREPGAPVRTQRFWSMPPAAPRRESLAEAAERLRAVLAESIHVHALADAKVGVFLSGGVDSTSVATLMRKWVPGLRAYTLVCADVGGWDEVEQARATARLLDVPLTEVEMTVAGAAEALPRFAADLDQPSVDGLNTWLISRAAARDVRGVLSGLGGDEWFAGYPVTWRMARQGTLRGHAEAAAGHAATLVARRMARGRLREMLERQGTRRSPLARWMVPHSVFSPEVAGGLTGDPQQAADSERELSARVAALSTRRESAVGLSCLLDVDVYMRDQLLRDVDATSMAHSLELRVPFVDIEVAKFSRSCADEHKLPGGANGASIGKRVLLEALRDVLPDGIARQPKRGFALPFARWMTTGLRKLVDDTCGAEVVRRRGLVDAEAVSALHREAARGAPGALYPRLWSLMVLELWARAALDAGAASEAKPLRCETSVAGDVAAAKQLSGAP